MTTMTTDLIARLESAKEGSRELDLDVAEQAGSDGLECPPDSIPALRKFQAEEDRLPYDDISMEWLPYYTTSIDAALTLVPEGYAGLTMRTNTTKPRVVIHCLPHSNKTNQYGEGNTLALALCIASLKAREESHG